MSIAAGEIGKQAIQETVSKTGGDAATRSGFDMPGEKKDFGAQDTTQGELGKPGKEFDGPWEANGLEKYENINRPVTK